MNNTVVIKTKEEMTDGAHEFIGFISDETDSVFIAQLSCIEEIKSIPGYELFLDKNMILSECSKDVKAGSIFKLKLISTQNNLTTNALDFNIDGLFTQEVLDVVHKRAKEFKNNI